MNRIWTVGINTFTEAIRDRVLYSIVLFAVLMIISSLIFSSLSAEQYNKIIKDFALTAISFFGILLSVFLGMGLVYKEIERKTVYNIFSKPVHRYQFAIGKYLGLAITIFIITFSMFIISFLIVAYTEIRYREFIEFYYGGTFFTEFIVAVYFQYLEFLIIIGVALAFSSFTSPILTILLTLLVIAIGRFSNDIRLFAEQIDNPAVSVIAEVLYTAVPNLEKFNFRSEAVYGGQLSGELFIYTTVYAVIYIIALLFLSIIIFERREFK